MNDSPCKSSVVAQSSIMCERNSLANAAEDLLCAVNGLGESLSMVLSSQMPQDCDKDDQATPSCDMAEFLRTYTNKIQGIRYTVQDLCDRNQC